MTMTTTRHHAEQSALLSYYEKISNVSQVMVEAAENADWPALADAEVACEQLIARMRSIGEPETRLDAAARRRRFAILRSILADDARIREITQPWASRLAPYVGAPPRRSRRP